MTNDNCVVPGEIRRTRVALNVLTLAIYLLAAVQAVRVQPSEAGSHRGTDRSVSFAAR
ncbi:hypothetical protein [Alsobacter sp. R-9]